MNFIDDYVKDLQLGGPGDSGCLERAQGSLQTRFPTDYVAFMLSHDGAEGPVGENAYIQIWPCADLVQRNRTLAVDEFVPGLTLFASDGGGTAYGFDVTASDTAIVEVPLIGMEPSAKRTIGTTFGDFLQYLFEMAPEGKRTRP
jgi:hypothetical protein